MRTCRRSRWVQERFSAALDFFRQEQHGKTRHPVSFDALKTLKTRATQTFFCTLWMHHVRWSTAKTQIALLSNATTCMVSISQVSSALGTASHLPTYLPTQHKQRGSNRTPFFTFLVVFRGACANPNDHLPSCFPPLRSILLLSRPAPLSLYPQAFPLRSPPPMRTAASFSTLPTPSSLRSPRTNGSNAFTPKIGGSGAVRVRTPAPHSRRESKEGKAKTKAAMTRKRVSVDR